MTDETAQHSAPAQDGETPPPAIQDGAPSTATKKTAPRRKVASRAKAAPVLVEAGETDGALVKKPVRARKPRSASATAAAPDQPELPDSSDPVSAPERQAHIETQVIPRDVYQRLEARTAQVFGRDGTQSEGAPPAAPAAPAAPPAVESTPAPTATLPPSGDSAAVPPEATRPPAEATPSGTLAEPPPEAPAPSAPQGRPFEGGPRGDYRPSQDRPSDGRQDRQNRPFDRDRQPQQGGGQFNRRDRQQQGGQYPNDRQQGQYSNDRQGGGQFNRRDRDRDRDREPQGPGPSYDQQGGQSNQGGQGQPGVDGFVSRPVEPQFGEGIVEVSGKGFGFLREAKRSFVQTPADIFVTPEVCRKYNLRDGQWIKGEIRRSSRGPQLFRLIQLNGEDVENYQSLPNFDELTTINPRKRIKLETVADRYTTRVMDLMTPIGKGQRGLIVAPPRTGKTTLLQHIAEAVVVNHPEMKLIILLVDERPEEVTEIRRSVPQAEIMASSNDSDLKSHVRIAQLAMERCKRLVEAGQHVFMLLDSITRMARAFNNSMSGSRATGSGGLSVGALEIPRKIFAAARNTEEAGSLTIMATALIETNSKMDDAIFQEFKGTGNMELVLDRKISDQRVYPAVDIFLSGTRREELLLQGWELDKINVIRRGLAGHKPLEAIERLLSFLKKFPTNAQMLMSLPG